MMPSPELARCRRIFEHRNRVKWRERPVFLDHRIPTSSCILPELFAENVIRFVARLADLREFHGNENIERPSCGIGIPLCVKDCAGAFWAQACPFPHAFHEGGHIGFPHRNSDTPKFLLNPFIAWGYNRTVGTTPPVQDSPSGRGAMQERFQSKVWDECGYKKGARITAPFSVRQSNHTLSLFAALSKPHSLPKRFCACVAGRLRSPRTTTWLAPRCGGGRYAELLSGSVHGSKFRRPVLREPVDRAGSPRGCSV